MLDVPQPRILKRIRVVQMGLLVEPHVKPAVRIPRRPPLGGPPCLRIFALTSPGLA